MNSPLQPRSSHGISACPQQETGFALIVLELQGEFLVILFDQPIQRRVAGDMVFHANRRGGFFCGHKVKESAAFFASDPRAQLVYFLLLRR